MKPRERDGKRAAEASRVRETMSIITDHIESVLSDPSGLGWHVLITDVDQLYADMRKSLLKYVVLATINKTDGTT